MSAISAKLSCVRSAASRALRIESHPVPISQEVEESCRARTRNYDEEPKQQQLTKARTQLGTQVLQDTDLTKVVTFWPSLTPAIRMAVLAVVSSAKA
jgi:hypothetical protein